MVRHAAIESPEHRLWRIRHLLPEIRIHGASLESYASLCKLLQHVQPDECYHLAAQSYVSYSFEDEFSTMQTNVRGTHDLLAALKQFAPGCKFYFAGSSEMFGKVESGPQNESTPFHPRSTYAISKIAGFDLCRYYREAHGIYICNGILFNHESPRRGLEFVTRKITNQAAKIKLGLAKEIRLGNLEARRDWGHAREYVEAMWMMLQQPKPDDYVIATGETHSVREFCEVAFSHVGLDYLDWVKVDPEFIRPADVECLIGDPSKAHRILGWSNEVYWTDLIKEMIEADQEEMKRAIHVGKAPEQVVRAAQGRALIQTGTTNFTLRPATVAGAYGKDSLKGKFEEA